MTLRLLPLAAILLAAPLAAAAAPAAPAPLTGAPRPLTGEERMGLTCASAFALVAAGQGRGDPAMAQYPPLAGRGREYFVRLSAQLMDDAGLDAEGLRSAARAEAAALQRSGVAPVMPACLAALDRALPPTLPPAGPPAAR